jgi:5-methylcytosine-specific restriction enzyme A
MAWSHTSRHQRGYGAAWDKLRVHVLARDGGVCQPCLRKGIVHSGNEVDHIVSKAKAEAMGWTELQINAPENLQTIHKDCHKAKTAEENGKQLKPQIGADGWPIDR